MKCRLQRLKGFTLVEILIASALSLVIFMAGFAAISGATTARTVSVNRVRSVENARLFFQVLERDLNSAYPGSQGTPSPNSSFVSSKDQLAFRGSWTGTDPLTKSPMTAPIVTDDIQFFTHADTAGVSNQYLAVRYYVNDFGQLCRAIYEGTYDPLNLPSIPNVNDPAATPPIDERQLDTYAMFDGVYSATVNFERWDNVTKAFVAPVYTCPGPGGLGPFAPDTGHTATHIHVIITLFDIDAKVDPVWDATTKTWSLPPLSSRPKRTYDKRFAIPSVFVN